ncbi:hypothetical protein MKEN_01034200 [Mycena kentingensis (nom. inval.)]|nr:hypothetical protein MKEN_01034200 [Mycena kentingensis (nom. inval.)]
MSDAADTVPPPHPSQSSPPKLNVAAGTTLVFNLHGPGPFTLNLNIQVSASEGQHTSEGLLPSPQRATRQAHRASRRLMPYLTPRRARAAPSYVLGKFDIPSYPLASPVPSEHDSGDWSVTEEWETDATAIPPAVDVFQDAGLREDGAAALYLNGMFLGSVQVEEDTKAEGS